jgi:hypothetical protein
MSLFEPGTPVLLTQVLSISREKKKSNLISLSIVICASV